MARRTGSRVLPLARPRRRASGLSATITKWTRSKTQQFKVTLGERGCTIDVPRGLKRKGHFKQSVMFDARDGIPWEQPVIHLMSDSGFKSVAELIRRAKLKKTDRVIHQRDLPDGAAFLYRTATGYLSARRRIRPKKTAGPKPLFATRGVSCVVNWKVFKAARTDADWKAAQQWMTALCQNLKCP